ncbi:hypothetical protein GCM10022198_23300 [Klugiella xanthotipulae]
MAPSLSFDKKYGLVWWSAATSAAETGARFTKVSVNRAMPGVSGRDELRWWVGVDLLQDKVGLAQVNRGESSGAAGGG